MPNGIVHGKYVNLGKNKDLMEACSLLREYACYVEKVREYAAEMEFPEAIAVSIFEYNEEQHLKLEKEESREEGRMEGEARFAKLLQTKQL